MTVVGGAGFVLTSTGLSCASVGTTIERIQMASKDVRRAQAIARLEASRDMLDEARADRREASRERVMAVKAARNVGITWQEIANTLGITKSAAIRVLERYEDKE